MRCYCFGGMKNQPYAILDSTGTTEAIIISLTSLPLTTETFTSPFFSYLFSHPQSTLNSPFFALLNQLNYFRSNFNLAAKSSLLKLNQVNFWFACKNRSLSKLLKIELWQPQNFHIPDKPAFLTSSCRINDSNVNTNIHGCLPLDDHQTCLVSWPDG